LNKRNILDCTLRDGSYITDGEFPDFAIRDIIQTAIDSQLDFVEVGYLNNTKPYNQNSTHFDSVRRISEYIPDDRKGATILAMVDIDRFRIGDFVPYDGKSVDGIRIVFYKHQVAVALDYAKAVKNLGYKLFMQPMVTIDYSINEYSLLAEEIANLEPSAVSIVDSFGYMTPSDFRRYYKVLDNVVSDSTSIGFHSHNNMNLALPVAIDALEYQTQRKLIIDSSLLGMGRGAGNLQTELIATYYNANFNNKYNVPNLIRLIDNYIIPIKKDKNWGYSPYFFLTAYNACHPNYAVYLLDKHQVSISEFAEYCKCIPPEMKTKCRRAYVEGIYGEFCDAKRKERINEIRALVL
jgi:4-hydroxy 2-oxovalerate aldolase